MSDIIMTSSVGNPLYKMLEELGKTNISGTIVLNIKPNSYNNLILSSNPNIDIYKNNEVLNGAKLTFEDHDEVITYTDMHGIVRERDKHESEIFSERVNRLVEEGDGIKIRTTLSPVDDGLELGRHYRRHNRLLENSLEKSKNHPLVRLDYIVILTCAHERREFKQARRVAREFCPRTSNMKLKETVKDLINEDIIGMVSNQNVNFTYGRLQLKTRSVSEAIEKLRE